MSIAKKLAVGCAIVGLLGAAGAVGAVSNAIRTSGAGPRSAIVDCPGGMTRLGHPFNEQMSIFPGDPEVNVNVVYTVVDDFFKVEDIDMGTHAGTHIDVPAHFVEDGRTLDQLSADEFVWPAYKIDVRDMDLTDGFVEKRDIRAYERANGRIRPGSLVILQTGAEEFFGLDPAAGDARGEYVDPDTGEVFPDLAGNVDDLFDFENAGFSGAAVQWLFDARDIDGVGSDAYGPDAYSDADFSATNTALLNDGVALVGIAHLDSVSVRSDVIIASAVPLTDGSGFSTDPIACHGKPRNRGR